jgi:hypothetical protein
MTKKKNAQILEKLMREENIREKPIGKVSRDLKKYSNGFFQRSAQLL